MKNLFSIFVFIIASTITLYGQKVINGQVVHGNEWIDYSKTYYKISLDEDGVYKVTKSDLEAIGFPTNTPMSSYKLIHLGEEVPIQTSTTNTPSSEDYFIFYGQKNKSEVDRFVYENDNMMLNPEHSIISDQSAYFLTVEENSTNKRYTTTNSNVNVNDSFEEFLWAKYQKLVASSLFKPTYNGKDNIKKSSMDNAEGYSAQRMAQYKHSVSLPNFVETGLDADFSLRATTNYGSSSTNKHDVSVSINGTEIHNKQYGNYTIFQVDSKIKSVKNNEIIVNTTAEENHRVSVPYYNIIYPRNLNINNLEQYNTFIVKPDNKKRNYLLRNATSDTRVLIPNQQEIINTSFVNTNASFSIGATSKNQDLIIFNDSTIKTPLLNEGRKYTDYASLDPNYIIITHPSLNATGGVDKYEEYRSSEIGGGFNTLVIDVTELYDQYAYGIDRHFASIRNFSNLVRNKYSSSSMFFLLGKGVQYRQYRTESQIENSLPLMVPTFGDPSSDSQLFCDFTSPVPFFTYGRFSAETAEHVDWYLEKIIDNEKNSTNPQTINDREWMKNILHMSGGGDNDYQAIANYLEVMENIIENNKVGANVTTFYKFSSDVIDDTFGNNALPIINNGLSILSFFGHGGVIGTDFKVVDPENFSNEGKLPLVISLGCYSGNCNTSSRGISEDYVKIEGKGGIAFLATSSTSYGSDLRVLGNALYSNYGEENYGGRLGEILMSSIKESYAKDKDLGMTTTLQQTILHGDPAFLMYSSKGADYVFDYSTANLLPSTIYSYSKNIEFCVDVKNIGQFTQQNLEVNFNLVDKDNNVVLSKNQNISSPKFSTNVCTSFTIDGLDLIGEYKVLAEINPDKKDIEAPSPEALNNNLLVNDANEEGYKFDIVDNNIFPTFPEEFSIVNNRELNLVATSFNAFSKKNNYIIQLDTVPSFDSPYLKTNDINQSFSPVKTTVNLLDIEDQVYYWRVKFNNTEDTWTNSSFVYNSTSGPGWNQSHYGQFLDDDLQQLELNNNQLSFTQNPLNIEILNGVNNSILYRNGRRFNNWKKNMESGFGVIIFDSKNKRPWVNPRNSEPLYGSVKDFTSNTIHFEYPTRNEEEQGKLLNLLENIIPDGANVIIVSLREKNTSYPLDFLSQQYADNKGLFTYLESQGASKINTLISSNQAPYIFAYKKNSNKVIHEAIGTDSEVELNAFFEVESVFSEGKIITTKIGKSSKFSTLIWDNNTISTDSTSVQIFGLDSEGNRKNINTYSQPGEYSLTNINTQDYDEIFLDYYIKDVTNLDPKIPQLRVIYEGFPDLVLERNGEFSHEDLNLNEGETLSIPIKISNYSSYDANGLFDLTHTIVDNQNTSTSYSSNYDGLLKGESIEEIIKINSLNQNGEYRVNFRANKLQNLLEEKYSNNNGTLKYKISQDEISPILDVTFDGQYISNNEIVSSNPNIKITVTDENIYKLITSKESFVIKLVDPNGEEIIINDNNSTFTPATDESENNFATLEINPELLNDGIYTLNINGKDASGNLAGLASYQVAFRVINKEMVSNIYNFPNPFSTSTQFIFTLTGNELPSSMVIRIYTITGKIVREITSEELGNLRIGINKTKYKWDGTDEYGNKLANGVYFYKVTTLDSSNKDYELFKNDDVSKNNLFKNGFGKLVIMR